MVLHFVQRIRCHFIPLLHEINDYRQYWHMTITPYGADIET